MRLSTFVFLLLISVNSAYGQSIEDQLQASIDSIYAAHPASVGIMVHVESPEKQISWSGASGYSDKNQKTPIEADQPALIASSIKTYVSASILRLVEMNRISLDQPIEHLLSKKSRKLFKGDKYDLNMIQVKHLLSHTSGIYNYANQDYIDHKNNNPKFRWTRDAQLALSIDKGDPLSIPGEHFEYADANYLLLTEIIEQVTGKEFYVAMADLLKYKENNINDTWFPTLENKPNATKELVHQYWDKYTWDSYNMDVSWDLYGGGGIACPTKDLAVFVQRYFNGNVVQEKAIQDLIYTYIPTPETKKSPYYLGLSKSTYNGLTGFGHGGFWGTVMLHFPSINSSVAVYILERGQNTLRADVMQSLTKILQSAYSDRLNNYSENNTNTSEFGLIEATLNNYIEGTANGKPDLLREAFHPDFNLYTVNDNDSLRIRSGEQYINNIKEGEKANRIGRIISIDYEKDAATAKVEILIPGWRIYTDYFLLLKYEGTWKIVQKSYSWREIPKE